MQFINGDSRHAQFTQKALSLPVLEADITDPQRGNQLQGVSGDSSQCLDYLLYLVTEEISQEKEAATVEKRTKPIEKKELAQVHPRHSRQRRCHGAQTWDE